ncbi:uncharacterized protein DSM5745_04072 [Aspergillus mulundensis]|uniref:Uncharacterized protein n=1 Tax=Aspergillus mulundensis TaxID=1810919 RepID=A0A3D8SBQ6_9EURO|nr:Uncharacterized protein DSM5745_04072 [Aspergillus mulundensis]RDW83746.1 Uncharacterized protein DSM5745_04072 [Aspergillus mulundensis]
MSTGLPYLHKLRKAQLSQLADITDLQDYEDDTKPELAARLDEHLQNNSSIFGDDERLADYYRRSSQSQPSSGSPSKRTSRTSRASRASSLADNTPIKAETISSGAASVTRSARRRPPRTKVEASPSEVSVTSPTQALDDVAPRDLAAETPARPYADIISEDRAEHTPRGPLVEVVAQSARLPPSPAVVTEAIERQTTELRKSIGDAWEKSGVQEGSDALRSALSSVKAVEVIVTLLEAFSVINQVVPWGYATTIPAIDAIYTPAIPIKVPDVFILVDGLFWAPVSLWLLTSVLLPLTAAYFFNISLQVAQSNSTGIQTRRSSSLSRSTQTTFDPLSFNIAKAIISYLVYAHGFNFWNLYSGYALQTVNASIPFQYAGILTGSGIGVVGTLYEAILRK